MAAIPHQDQDVPDEILKRIHFIEGGESTDVGLKASFSDYGWIYILKIINNTNHIVYFENPNQNKTGEIKKGESEDSDCAGYVPYYSYDKKYVISYFNENVQERVKILIKDLGGDWLASFYQEGRVEDVRALNPRADACWAGLYLTINTDGYEIYEKTSKCKKGKEMFG